MRTLLLVPLFGCGGTVDETPTPPATADAACVDADGDGSCEGADCDDANAQVGPQASDIPYNGSDEDCDGQDLVDVDGDGHDGAQVGGDDCNDGNPLVYPQAPEECYADIDYDCDGIYGGDDCDADGFAKGVDCNDEDETVFPGAPDSWYDGVDSDCEGNSDYDADADGDDHDAYGGLDCDDADPLVGGALPELWDGVDRDCDGVVDVLSNKDAAAGYDSSGGVGDYVWGGSVAVLGDLDGDGHGEIAAGDLGKNNYTGGVYILSSGVEDGRPSDVALAIIDSGIEGDYFGWDLDAIGDLDGDGLEELIVGSPLYEGFGGALIFGGADLSAGGTLTDNDSLAKISGADLLGLAVGGGADFTGDGVPEAIASVDMYGLLWAGVYDGAELAAGGNFDEGDAVALVSDAEAFGGGLVGRHDLTGDGATDLLIGSTDCASGGRALLFEDPAGVLGVSDADAELEGGTCLALTLGVIPDADGDGYPEVTIADPMAPAADGGDFGGVVYVVDGDELTDGIGGASMVVQEASSGGYLRVEPDNGDHDGDAVPDLLVGRPGTLDVYQTVSALIEPSGAGYVWFYSGEQVADGGTLSGDDATATFYSVNDKSTFGLAWDVGSLDEDSVFDLVIGVPMLGTGKLYSYRAGY